MIHLIKLVFSTTGFPSPYMVMEPSTPPNLDDYSSSATTVIFDPPVPLLRGPLPAGYTDYPELGPYVLAFASAESWAVAYKRCETLIREQCEEGARIGCAVTASNNCKPPWWRNLSGLSSEDMREREKCEVREFEGCLAAAGEKCSGFAKDKCSRPFLDARIAVARGDEAISANEVEGLVWLASMPEDSGFRDLLGSRKQRTAVTNYRARDMLKAERECLVE
ncbi:PREDICTED: uncharacterized protein LOC104817569 [Tarenaya hassleriana]|uniref:uncharacterized protein LOC104817569 n=1 Tax=Tarenaya hassleriana TaxID=28532 RepID=UPI00053C23A8|nr:PREDICTED: uncharacterized protein LOC104817569 [Tarenaya hassleriana]